MPVVNPLFDIIPDEEIISVACVAAPMTEGSANVTGQSVLYSVLTGQDIATNLLASSMDLFLHDIDKFVEYGRYEYVDGLPYIHIDAEQGYSQEEAALKEALYAEHGIDPSDPSHALTIHAYSRTPYYSATTSAAEYLTMEQVYDDATSIIWDQNPWYPGHQLLWEVDMGAPIQEDGTIRLAVRVNSGSSSAPIWGDPVYIYVPDKYPGQAIGNTWYTCRYQFQFPPGLPEPEPSDFFPYFFIYRVGSGEYPPLDGTSEMLEGLDVHPIAAIRVDHVDYADPANAGTPRYDTTKELLDILGVDIQAVYEGVMENPDQAEVDHVYVMMGCNPNDIREEAAIYMWHFADYYFAVLAGMDNTNGGSLWQIGFVSNTFNIEIEFDGYSAYTAYSTKAVGTYWMEIRPFLDNYSLYVYRQVAPNVAEVRVLNWLQQNVNVYGAKDKWHHIKLVPTPEDGQIIVVPMQQAVLNRIPRLKRNEVAYTGLYTVFHAYEIDTIEWYEDGFLGLIIAIIGIFVPGMTGWDDFIASLSIGSWAGIKSFGIYVAQTMLKSLVVSVSSIIIGKAFGLEGLVAAAAALWWFTSPGIGAPDWMPDIWGAITGGGPAQGWITGEITEGIVQIKVDELTLQMQQIQDAVQAEKDAAYALWQEAQPPFRLDPLGLYTAIDMTPYDSPATYIGRKTNSTQLSQMCGYDAIVNFYDNQLNLYPV